MSFLKSIFGGDDGGGQQFQPLPEADEQRQDIDPNFDQQLAEASRIRRSILSRRGRSDLVTGRSGIAIVGGNT